VQFLVFNIYENCHFIADDVKPIVQSNYSSELNNKSQKHSHLNCYPFEYYYDAIQIDVNTSGYYMFLSKSTFNTYGYLYEYSFDPHSSEDRSLARYDYPCKDYNFKMTTYLQFNITYVLVITTPYDRMNAQGPFSVIISGSDKVYMKRIGMCVFNLRLVKISEG